MFYYYNCDVVYKTAFDRGTLTLPHHFFCRKEILKTLLQGIVVGNKNRRYEHQINLQATKAKKKEDILKRKDAYCSGLSEKATIKAT